MKLLYILFVLAILSLNLQAQNDYNAKGDMALQKKDFNEARAWFGEGLNTCDPYSIRKLTDIWKEHNEMRASMRFTMSRCFNCLKDLAENNENNDAMYQLSDYYKHGIGVSADSLQADYWLKEYGKRIGITQQQAPAIDSTAIAEQYYASNRNVIRFLKQFDFFAGYLISPTMPIGVTAGFYKKFGAYASYKIDLHSGGYYYLSDNTQVPSIPIEDPKYEFKRKQWNCEMVIAGGIYRYNEKIFLTAGVGHGKREYLREIVTDDYFETGKKSEWTNNIEASYYGFTVEAGGMYKWKRFMALAGFNSVRFKDIDIYIGLAYTF